MQMILDKLHLKKIRGNKNEEIMICVIEVQQAKHPLGVQPCPKVWENGHIFSDFLNVIRELSGSLEGCSF